MIPKAMPREVAWYETPREEVGGGLVGQRLPGRSRGRLQRAFRANDCPGIHGGGGGDGVRRVDRGARRRRRAAPCAYDRERRQGERDDNDERARCLATTSSER